MRDWAALDEKLEQEVLQSRRLERELSEVKANFVKEADEHDALWVADGLVFDDLGVASEQERSSLTARAISITNWAHEMAKQALHLGVQQLFVIARSHYENIDLQMMSQALRLPTMTTRWTKLTKRLPLSRGLGCKQGGGGGGHPQDVVTLSLIDEAGFGAEGYA